MQVLLISYYFTTIPGSWAIITLQNNGFYQHVTIIMWESPQGFDITKPRIYENKIRDNLLIYISLIIIIWYHAYLKVVVKKEKIKKFGENLRFN